MAEHNHITRDIKPQGECPACDRYHQQAEDIATGNVPPGPPNPPVHPFHQPFG